MKRTRELRKMTDNELKARKQEIVLLFAGCHKGVKPTVPPDSRKRIKVELARIETILKERKKNENK